MKKKILSTLSIIFAAIILTACNATKLKPYSIESGAYGFEKATMTNLLTKEVTEKTFDDIINDKTEYLEWGCLFSFGVGVNKDTEYIFTTDNRCFILNGGLAYELIGINTLKLHLPRWQGNNYDIYDVIIILGNQKLYGL